MAKDRQRRGLKSVQALQKRKQMNKLDAQLKEKKHALAIKAELQHKLETVLASADAVEIEVADNALADFIVILDDPAFGLYAYEQVDDNLFIFRAKDIL